MQIRRGKRTLAVAIAATAVFTLALMGAGTISQEESELARLSGGNSSTQGATVAQTQHGNFQASLKRVSQTLYAWTSNTPKDEGY